MELSEGTAMINSPDLYRCPSHLETLTGMDQLFVFKEENMEECLAEVCCGIKPFKKYNVKDNTGNKVFGIIEDSECCERQCFAGARSFIMNVTDHSNQEIIRLVHPFVCCSHELEVQSPPGTAIGYVQQNLHVCLPKFTVANERGEPAFNIEGPCMGCTCCTDENFELVSLNGAAIDRSFGKIFKPFSYSEPNAGADFVLRFPRHLDVKMKATVLGACMLIRPPT
ncbi:phospholipid scramblase 2 isoform X1 [Onychostoma macrolepis]|uniref:phospholipid scramblase 2 isoform X1 n=1 Tax=Onychostoma macrolepis TaxID=369639 RepID=UPI00272BF5FD|nr:phospholipid scramblase 2 isoform X1 [Onychostoma macrolepis]